MKPTPLILDYIDRHLTYDPLTGIISKGNQPFGTLSSRGRTKYVKFTLILDTTYEGCSLHYQALAHQVGWYLTYGIWPEQWIDHVDGNGANNRLANLRLVTPAQNLHNSRKPLTGKTSQYKGVNYESNLLAKPWRATIQHAGKKKTIGRYATEQEAALAYDEAAYRRDPVHASLNFPRSL